MIAIYFLGGENPPLTRAAAASASLLWMRSTRSLFAPAGAFATLAVDESLPRLPAVRDWQWVAEGVQLILIPAICGSLFLFASQSAAVWLRTTFAWQEPLSLQDTWLVGELRNAFPSLPKRELSKLLKQADEVFYEPRSILTEQGSSNKYLWLVISGKLLVEVSGQVASTLERKAIVGEVTFLDPRDKLATATVYAAAPNGARTLRWRQEKLRAFCEYENSLGEKLMAAISEELIEKMVRGRGAGRRSPEESLKLLIQLRRAFPQLGTAEVPRFLKVAENICYPQGSLLTTQGEKNEFLWLLLSGSLSVIVDSQMVAQLSEGALIGEATFLGFAEEGRATATVRSDDSEGVQTLRWSQESLRELLNEDIALREKLVPAMSEELLRRLSGKMTEAQRWKGKSDCLTHDWCMEKSSGSA
ncbi:unnamed protein product [Durusdinium trenchii]